MLERIKSSKHKLLDQSNIPVIARKWIFNIIRVVLILSFCFVILYPILYMVSQGIRSWEDLYDPSVVWIPKHFSLKSMKLAIEGMDYAKSALSSGGIALLCTVAQLVCCSMAGYGFARFRFPFKKLLFGLCLFSVVVPMQMVIIPTFMQIKHFNVLGIGALLNLFTGSYPDFNNTIWGVLIPALLGNGIRGSMYIFIFRQFFRGIPKDLEDAAHIDGAGHVRSFLSIIIPNAGAPFLVVFILSVIWYWNDGLVVNFFYNSAPSIAMALLNIVSNNTLAGTEYTVTEVLAIQQAGAILMVLPPLVMFLFLQRFFVESIDKTGLK